MSLRRLKQGIAAELRCWRALLRDESGQAMMEYSTVSYALLLGLAGAGWPFMKDMMLAYQNYYNSIYFVLNLPLP